MKVSNAIITLLPFLLGLVASESQVSKRPLVFHNWPPKNSKQLSGKQRTLVVQIRSDQPVPLMFKGRPGFAPNHGHTHAHAHHALALYAGPNSHLRNVRPLKLSAPVFYKSMPAGYSPNKSILRKPLKIKLSNSKNKSKPAAAYEKPFKFEQPSSDFTVGIFSGGNHHLPLENSVPLENEHFVPIHTIPAPNLALQDNHLHAEETYSSQTQEETKSKPKPQSYHQASTTTQSSLINQGQAQYQVFEEQTNDQTLIDPYSGTQKLFAPDPDPSLPTSKLRLATEPFNQPSIGKPLAVDVQSNHLSPAQPLVQVVDTPQHGLPIQFTQQAALPSYITANVAAVQAVPPVPLYNPTYLVTQSNNLYTQHKHQLYNNPVVEAGYYNADLTQQVAPDGRILQPAKEAVYDSAPQFAALIAAPALNEEPLFKPAAIYLPNVAAAPTVPESGFVVSNYYGNGQESSQLLQAYAEEESQRQRLEAEQASIELQRQQHLLQQEQEQQQILQQQHNHLLELQQQQQQREQQQQQHNHLVELQQQRQQEQQHHHHLELQQQHQQQQLEKQQQQEHHRQQLQQQQHQQQSDPAASAFEEHARLVQQQLGNTPLRIFVPDEESPTVDLPRLKKRSDEMKKGTVEDVQMRNKSNQNSMFEVSSSVEVSHDGKSDTVTESNKDED